MVKILVVGQSPPPYGGQALMIQKMLEGDYGEQIRLYHVRMAFSKEMNEVGKFRLRKLSELCKVIIKIVITRFLKGANILYYPPAGPNIVPFLRDVVILISTRWLFKKTIFHLHASGIGELWHDLLRVGRFAFRLAYYYPEVVIRLSELAPNDGVILKGKREYILPNGIEDTYLSYIRKTQVDVQKDDPVNILFVGVLSEGKGLMVMLRACKILSDKWIAFHVNLMGRCESEKFIKRVQTFLIESHLYKSVTFLGVMKGNLKWQAFESAHIFCLPTYAEFETFPIVLLEAMQFALPVVATRWRGIPSVVEDGVTGFLVPVRDHNALAAKLDLLIKDPSLRKGMGEEGRKRYLKYFTIDKYRENLKKVFVSLDS